MVSNCVPPSKGEQTLPLLHKWADQKHSKQDFFLHHLIKLYPKYDNKEARFEVLRAEKDQNSGELFVLFIKNIHL